MTPTARALLDNVRDNPGNAYARMVYADALQDAGDEEGAHLQRAIAEPDNDGHRLALADALERTAGTVKRCTGTHRHDGEKFPLISGGFAWDAHGVIHRANPKQPHHHCDEKCRVSDGRAEWSEFIRMQCELAKPSDCRTCSGRRWYSINDANSDDCRLCSADLRARERELWPDVRGRFEGYGVEPCYQTGLMVHQPPDGEIVQRSTVLIQRGLPSVVRCTLAEWMGDVCKNCWGEGWRANHGSDHPIIDAITCPTCHGSGRTPGIGPRLAQAWPIDRVEVTDKRPWENSLNDGPVRSTWLTTELVDTRTAGNRDRLPPVIFETLYPWATYRGIVQAGFDFESAARAALSDALIAWARGLVIEGAK